MLIVNHNQDSWSYISQGKKTFAPLDKKNLIIGSFFGAHGMYTYNWYIRFTNVHARSKSKISTATLSIHADTIKSGGNVVFQIFGLKIPNVPRTTKRKWIHEIPKTNHSTTCAGPKNWDGKWIDFDVRSIIQEIVNQKKWRYNHNIGLVAHRIGGLNPAGLHAHSVFHGYAPQLNIELKNNLFAVRNATNDDCCQGCDLPVSSKCETVAPGNILWSYSQGGGCFPPGKKLAGKGKHATRKDEQREASSPSCGKINSGGAGHIGYNLKCCLCPSSVGMGIDIKVTDDTCGPSPISGAPVREPPFKSDTCSTKRCKRERAKGTPFRLPMRTGDPENPVDTLHQKPPRKQC